MDAPRDFRRNLWLPSARRRLKPRSCCPSPLECDSLELVDGDQAGAPGHFDRLDVRQQPPEGGAADAERLGGLASSVGEPFDVRRLADNHSWRQGLSCERRPRFGDRRGVTTRLVGATLLAAARHGVRAYTNDRTFLHLGASVSRLLFLYEGSGYSPAVECQRPMERPRLRPCSSSITRCIVCKAGRSCSRPRTASMRAWSSAEATEGRKPCPSGSRTARRRKSS
jgi:hypothetical protein